MSFEKKDKQMSKLKVASMFAGIGGICLGFKQAGFEIVWANEIDPSACNTYRNNFGDSYLVQADIKKIDTKTIPNFDVLTAGFPCQPFSIVGKQKGFNDERGTLFFEIQRVIKAKKPKVILLENVANLIEHNNGKSFEKVYLALAEEGYVVRFATLNPKQHSNIPQQRNRVFLVAFLDNSQSIDFKFPEEIPLNNYVNNLINTHEKHDEVYYYKTSHYLYKDLLKNVKKDGYIYKIDDSGVRPYAYKIAPTLTANMGTFPDRVPVTKDDFGIRKLTPYECLLLQGFPSNYKFPKGTTLNQAYKQIGNSVCVPIIEKLAKEIKRVLGNG